MGSQILNKEQTMMSRNISRTLRRILGLLMFLIAMLLVEALSLPPRPALAQGFLYDVEILDKEKIRALADDQLLDRYIDAIIELDASSAFHRAAGFNPKEYKKYKLLLRYRVDLMMEIQRRELEVPKVDFLNER